MTNDTMFWYLVGATVSGVIAALLASSRRIPPWAGFLLGFTFGVFGIAVVALFRRTKDRMPVQPAPAGWYPDPSGQPVQRWWTGTQWT